MPSQSDPEIYVTNMMYSTAIGIHDLKHPCFPKPTKGQEPHMLWAINTDSETHQYHPNLIPAKEVPDGLVHSSGRGMNRVDSFPS
jgi:hypothetical protein